MWLVLSLLAGLVVGSIATRLFLRSRSIGNLVVIDDPDDGTYMFMEITRSDVEHLRKEKIIKLTVVDRGMHTHK